MSAARVLPPSLWRAGGPARDSERAAQRRQVPQDRPAPPHEASGPGKSRLTSA